MKMPARTAARGRRSWARLIWKIYGVDPQVCPKCTIANQVPQNRGGGEREIVAVILQDDVLVKILDHVGLPTRLPVFKPARGPPVHAAGEPATRSLVPLHFEEGFFADPDYSEFDCIDDEPPEVDRNPPSRVESKDSRPPKGLLELVDYFPGKKLCCTKVPLHVLGDPFWGRGASELLEDEENRTS